MGTSKHARKKMAIKFNESFDKKVPAEDRANEVDLSKEYLLSVKTLGLLWIAK